MKTIVLFLFCAVTLAAQTAVQNKGVVNASVMGLEKGLSGPVIVASDGAMFIAVASADNTYELKAIPHKWATEALPNGSGKLPYNDYLSTAITVSGGKVWVGSKDELSYQVESGWTKVLTSQAGRTTQVDRLTTFESGKGVFASVSSIEPGSANPRTTLELITPTERRELFTDEGGQFAFSNGVKLNDGSYLFASRNGNERCLMRVRPEGSVRLIAAPPGMPVTAQPALVVKGNAGKYYAIYQASTERSLTQPSFVVSFDESTEQTEYIPLGDMGWRITGAVMAGGTLMIAADNGVISVKDKKASRFRFYGNIEGIERDVEAMGITTLNRGTALVTTQVGLVMLPMSLFDQNFNSNDFTDLTAVNTKNGRLNFESLVPTDIIDWQVFDMGGRVVAQGQTSVSDMPNGLNLPTLASGSYNVVMTSAGNAVYLQRVVISK